jgi:hypothetical protein
MVNNGTNINNTNNHLLPQIKYQCPRDDGILSLNNNCYDYVDHVCYIMK